nr:SHOCT domain-containing protein [Rhizobium sp. Q54]
MPAIGAKNRVVAKVPERAKDMEKIRYFAARAPLILGIGALPILLAGCNSFALDDGIPNTAPTATVVSDAPPPPTGPIAKRDSGTYPTFDRGLTAANVQIADDEAAGSEAELSALAAARADGSVSEAEYTRRLAELRRLAAEHGREAEAAIAN